MKEFLKKYWWVIAIIIVLIILSSIETPKPCREITRAEWDRLKTEEAQKNGGDWTAAHFALLERGFCEQH